MTNYSRERDNYEGDFRKISYGNKFWVEMTQRKESSSRIVGMKTL